MTDTTTNDETAGAEPKPIPRFLAQPAPMPKVPGKIGIAFIVALVALAGVNGGWPLLAVIGSLVLIVSLHELGHFLTAKWAGMKVTEFFLGVGPRLWSVKRGETEYGVKLIPAVAYVRIVGMNNLEEVDDADEPRSFRQQVFHKRLIVVCAGSAMHFLMAFVAIFGLLVLHGGQHGHVYAAEPTTGYEITSIVPDSPAAAAGVQPHDIITVFNGDAIADQDALVIAIRKVPNTAVDFTVLRNGATQVLHATVGSEDNEGHLGIGVGPIEPPLEKVGVLAAVPRTLQDFGHISVQMVQGIGEVLSPSGIGHLFSLVADHSDNQGPVVADPNAPSQPPSTAPAANQDDNRPVSIIGIAQIGSQLDTPELIFFVFVIVNIFFGIFNLLPLLPFDGGHAAIAIYEKIRSMRQGGKPYRADILKMLPVTYGVVAVLLLVGGSAMYLDIVSSIKLN